eukprot:13665485-Alexandrium_andersonii.AAC.1
MMRMNQIAVHSALPCRRLRMSRRTAGVSKWHVNTRDMMIAHRGHDARSKENKPSNATTRGQT